MPLTLDQFRQELAALRLVPTEDIEAAVAKIRAEKPPRDLEAERLARLLVRQTKLTAFQAQQIYFGRGETLVLGNYVVLDKIGQGGMGVVFKAKHRRMKRTVALKTLSPPFLKRPEMVRRFQWEVEIAAKAEHPNIITAHDADEVNGTLFLVMQYIDGTNLLNLVQEQGPLPVEQTLDCLLQAARGLQHVHQSGIVHRDVKPSNLLLDRHGTLRILDLGMARVVSDKSDNNPLTAIGQIMGTVDFMAPEQAIDSRFADARSDIYALGMTLWYLLTGRPAYERTSVIKKLLAHHNAPIPSLSRACPQASPELEAVFEKMVAKSPNARYQTLAGVIVDLERLAMANVLELLPPVAEEDRGLSDFLREIEHSNRSCIETKVIKPRHIPSVEPATKISFSQIEIEPPQPFLIEAEPCQITRRVLTPSSWWGPLKAWMAGGGLAILMLFAGRMILGESKNSRNIYDHPGNKHLDRQEHHSQMEAGQSVPSLSIPSPQDAVPRADSNRTNDLQLWFGR